MKDDFKVDWRVTWPILIVGCILSLVVGLHIGSSEEVAGTIGEDYYRNQYRVAKEESIILKNRITYQAKTYRELRRYTDSLEEFKRKVIQSSTDAEEMISYAENKKQTEKVVVSYYFAIMEIIDRFSKEEL